MQYHYFPGSHWSRVISLVLAEKALEPELCLVDIRKNASFEPDYIRLNPKGVVPTLVDGDTVVCGSPRIAAYLDGVAGPPVYAPPDSPDAVRWSEELEAFPLMHFSYRVWVEGRKGERSKHILDDKIERAARYATRYPELRQQYLRKHAFFEGFRAELGDAEEVQRMEREGRAVLGRMGDAVSDTSWLGGEAWSFADAIATSILWRLVDLPLMDEWHHDDAHPLRRYFERLRARPSFERVFG